MCMINLLVGLKFENLYYVVENYTVDFYLEITTLTQRVSSLQINSNLVNIWGIATWGIVFSGIHI